MCGRSTITSGSSSEINCGHGFAFMPKFVADGEASFEVEGFLLDG